MCDKSFLQHFSKTKNNIKISCEVWIHNYTTNISSLTGQKGKSCCNLVLKTDYYKGTFS